MCKCERSVSINTTRTSSYLLADLIWCSLALLFVAEATRASDVVCSDAFEVFPDPSSCNKFFECQDSILTHLDCLPGRLFNVETGYCDVPEKVNCNSITAGTNSVKKLSARSCLTGSLEFAYNPADCSTFFQCGRGFFVELSCLPGFLFDSTRLLCDFPENVVCATIEPEEEVVPICPVNGNFFLPHATSCSKFHQCWNGVVAELDCLPGLLFNSKLGLCDFPENVVCNLEDGSAKEEDVCQDVEESMKEVEDKNSIE